MKKSIDWGGVALVFGGIAVVLLLVWAIAGGIYATDSQDVEKTGNGCYLIVEKVYNMPFTPGENSTTRGIYCKVK